MQALQSKAPGPRKPSQDDTPSRPRPIRVSHACDRCRLMRTKCSGGERCRKCEKDEAECRYGDGKREKNKRDLIEGRERIASLGLEKSELVRENAELIDTLRSISSLEGFPTGAFPQVAIFLSRATARDLSDLDTSDPRSQPIRRTNTLRSRSILSPVEDSHPNSASAIDSAVRHQVGEAVETAGNVGSPRTQGELSKRVDLEYGAGAAGFIGKASEISWVQRCKEHLAPVSSPGSLGEPIETTQIQLDQHNAAANKVNYHLDDADLLSIDEDTITPEDIPPPEIAFLLAEACFHSLQGAFLFIYRAEFLVTLSSFSQNIPLLSWRQRQWLATANIVFAIGARWLQFTHMDDLTARYSHLEFYARARALGLDHRVVFDHPVLEQVQSLGLLGFYLFVNGSIARAWTITGHALRHATALGLHLRVADAAISLIDRLRRARIFFSLYNLEILISETTGRPKSITVDDITVGVEDAAMRYPVPDLLRRTSTMTDAASESWITWQLFLHTRRRPTIGMEENTQDFFEPSPQIRESDSLNQFIQRVGLCSISHRVGSALYSAKASEQSWEDFQNKLKSLDGLTLAWRRGLPASIQILPQDIHANESDPRPQIELALYYHSVRMILHRPCVCKIDIMHESLVSKDFNLKSARECVRSAVNMMDLFPEVAFNQAHELFQLLPWWAALHYIAQAASILMLELTLQCEHVDREGNFGEDQAHIFISLKRAMDFLWLLATTSRSAAKAWSVFRQLFVDTMALYPLNDISWLPMDL